MIEAPVHPDADDVAWMEAEAVLGPEPEPASPADVDGPEPVAAEADPDETVSAEADAALDQAAFAAAAEAMEQAIDALKEVSAAATRRTLPPDVADPFQELTRAERQALMS